MFFWLPALACDNLFFAYFAYKVIPPQPRRRRQSGGCGTFGGCLSLTNGGFFAFFFFSPSHVSFLSELNILTRGHVTIRHQRRRLGPRCRFQIRAKSVISTFCNDTQGRDCAEKGESSSDRLALATARLSSGCQIRRVNYIEILSEMTDEICLSGLGVELQVIHDM